MIQPVGVGQRHQTPRRIQPITVRPDSEGFARVWRYHAAQVAELFSIPPAWLRSTMYGFWKGSYLRTRSVNVDPCEEAQGFHACPTFPRARRNAQFHSLFVKETFRVFCEVTQRNEVCGEHHDECGYIDAEMLRKYVPLLDADFYISIRGAYLWHPFQRAGLSIVPGLWQAATLLSLSGIPADRRSPDTKGHRIPVR